MLTTSLYPTLCATCGKLIDEDATVCPVCGTARMVAPFFYSVSVFKFAFFASTTFGIYTLCWFWNQWRADAPHEGRGSVLFKTIFSGIFFYAMARQVKEEAEKYGLHVFCPPVVLTVVLLVVTASLRLVRGDWFLLVTLLVPLPLIPVQVAINRVNVAISAQSPTRWRWWEIVIGVVLGLLWLMILAGFLLPDPSPQDGVLA